jgi:hypothetical protein
LAARLDENEMWSVLTGTLVFHPDALPLAVAGRRDDVLEARALPLHAVAGAPIAQVVAHSLRLARHAHFVAYRQKKQRRIKGEQLIGNIVSFCYTPYPLF